MYFKRKIIILIILSLLLAGQFCLAAELIPNDPDLAKQWYLSKLQMTNVWSMETGQSNVVVAVIDSGVDVAHPDLRDNIWVNHREILGDNIDNDNNGFVDDINGWDFVENDNDPSPKFSTDCFSLGTCSKEAILHGTLVAGVISAIGNNNFGVSGITWKAKIMPLRVLSEDGSGSTYDVVRAINYAIDNKADIINLSFVGETFDLLLEEAVNRAYQAGIVIVAAAGNENTDGHAINLDLRKMYPICQKGDNNENIIIGVGGSNANNQLSSFSNFGSSCIDVLAPGEDFWGTLVYKQGVDELSNYFGGEYSGTSLAAPIVSGIAALIKSYKPALNNNEIRDLILNNTENIDAQNPAFVGKLGKGLVSPLKIFQTLRTSTGTAKLIKGSTQAVYYYGADGKRYVFPDKMSYFSWYQDFSELKTISDSELAAISLGGVVTYEPGSLVKISSLPQVYAVSAGGVLRWVKTEELAASLYGPNWASLVHDLADSFFIIYKMGSDIATEADFNPTAERFNSSSIDVDKGLVNN